MANSEGSDWMIGNVYKKALATVEFLLEHVATWLFILFFIAVLLQIFFRYILNAPLTWSEEAARYLNVWAVLLGAALAIKRKDHLRVDLIDNLVKKWPFRAQIVFYFFTTFLSALVVVSFIKGGYFMTVDRWSVKLTMLPLPQGAVYLALFTGAVLMMWFLLHQLIEQLQMLIKGRQGGEKE